MEKHIYVVSEDIIIYEHSGVLPTLWTLECGTRRYMNTYASFFPGIFSEVISISKYMVM